MKTALLATACALAVGATQPAPGPNPPGAAPNREKKVLTPEQIFREGFVGETRIEFKVGAVSLSGAPFGMEEATDRTPVPTADGKLSVSRLRVVLSEKVEARLGQLGIEDLRTHFYGKVVRVRGNLRQEVNAGGVGNRLITYSLTIESLDQIEFVGKK